MSNDATPSAQYTTFNSTLGDRLTAEATRITEAVLCGAMTDADARAAMEAEIQFVRDNFIFHQDGHEVARQALFG